MIKAKQSRFEWTVILSGTMAALLAAIIFSLPLLLLQFAGGSYLPFANESLAYRYFTSLRIMDGQGGAVWTAQGQLVTLLQNGFIWIIQMLGSSNLKSGLEQFGMLTNLAAGALMFFVCLCAALDRRLLVSDKVLVLLLGPVTLFSTVNAGFYYSILPDYYAFSLVLISASVYLTIRFYRDVSVFNVRHLYIAGALCGVVAANKLTLLGPAGIAVLVAILRPPLDWRMFLGRTAKAGVIFFVVLGFIFSGVYLFDLRQAAIAFLHMLDFLKTAGAEPGFWEGNFWLFQEIYNYDKIFFAWLLATLFLTLEMFKQKAWRAGVILGSNLLVAVLLGIGLYKRGAGTTFFEVSCILVGLTGLCLAVALGFRQRGVLASLLPGVIFLGALTQFNFSHNWMVVTKSRDLAKTSWEIREYAESLERPVIVVIPDESYVANGVEDLVNKGLRDLSTGQFGSSKALKERIMPRTEFREVPGKFETGTIFIWVEKWDILTNKPLKEKSPDEARRWADLSRVAALNDCRIWRTGYSEQLLVNVCVIDRLN
jgi:hypothetical protein